MSMGRQPATIVLFFAFGWGACGPFRPTATCEIAAGPSGVQLYRQSEATRFEAHIVPVTGVGVPGPICEGSSAADRCELSDDVEALLGGAFVGGPDGTLRQQHVCPQIQQAIRCEKASLGGPTCPDSQCPNLQLSVEGKDGMVAHVLMYDDPSCHPRDGGALTHRNPCSPAPTLCYYRVHSVALDLSGPNHEES